MQSGGGDAAAHKNPKCGCGAAAEADLLLVRNKILGRHPRAPLIYTNSRSQSGIPKPRKGQDTVPEILDTWEVKFGGRHQTFPCCGFPQEGFIKQEKLLMASFSFCWLPAVPGAEPVFAPQGWRGGSSPGCCSGDSPMTLRILWSVSFPGVGSVCESLGFGEEKGC